MAECLKRVASKLACPSGRAFKDFTDDDCAGLQLRVTKAGRREWLWRESGGQRHSLGPLRSQHEPDGLTYADAVERVHMAVGARRRGADPVKIIRPDQPHATLRTVITTYLSLPRLSDVTRRDCTGAVRPMLDGWIDEVDGKEVVRTGIGDLPMEQVTAQVIYDVVQRLHLTGSPDRWRIRAARKLTGIIGTAVAHATLSTTKLLPENFPNEAKQLLAHPDLKPKETQGYARALAPDQLVVLRRAIRDCISNFTRNRRSAPNQAEHRHPMGFLLLEFCLLTGCRPGEAAKLKIADIGSTRIELHMEHNRVRKTALREHKTARRGGQRTIYLSEEARGVLEQAEKWRHREGLDASPYVFAGPGKQRSKCGYIRHPHCYARALSERVQIDLKAHSMRSLYINALRQSGVTVECIAPIVGHANPSTTMQHYVTVTEDEVRRAVDIGNQIFSEASSRPAVES